MRKPTLTVIIPVFNEEKTIAKVLKMVKTRPEVTEIIVVDDASTDDTRKVSQNFKNPRIKIFSHKSNLGKGGAIVTGLSKATGEYVIIQDADLEYFPSDYPALLAPIKNGRAQVVFGTRFWAKKKGYLVAQIGNFLLTQLANLLFGTSLTDAYTCYKLLPRKLFLDLSLSAKRFEIEAEIVAKLGQRKIQIVEVPISYRPRSYQEGKKINFGDFLRGVATLTRIRFRP